jgi:putative flavoprotein involved in K+ transport
VLGLPWLYTWGSGRFVGVGRDAAFICEHIAEDTGAVTVANTAPPSVHLATRAM